MPLGGDDPEFTDATRAAAGPVIAVLASYGIDGENAFHAALEFSDGTVVDSRASDAIALAARTDCPILCTETVLDEAGLVMIGDGELREPPHRSGEGEQQLPPETQVEQFRDFLDNVDPEDF